MPPKRSKLPQSGPAPKRQTVSANLNIRSHPSPNDPPSTEGAFQTTSFLDLPRELRDRIYHEIWNHIPALEVALPLKRDRHGDNSTVYKESEAYFCSTAPKYHVFNVRYVSHESVVYIDPLHYNPRQLWLLANKRMCVKTLQQFQRKATWTYRGIVRSGRDRLHIGSWKAATPLRRKAHMGALLLLPSGAYSMNLEDHISMLATNELDSEEKPSYCVTFWSDTDIFQRLASSFAATSSLRMLSLSMVVRRCADERYSLDILVTVQSQPLLNLNMPNLQVFQAVVTYPKIGVPDNVLKEQFLVALSEADMTIIGGSGVETRESMEMTQNLTHRFTHA
jgi:hypothetical protein